MADENEAKDFDTIADELLDKAEKETPSEETSTDIKPEDNLNDTDTSGTEPVKTEQVKEVEDDESLSVEEKIEKVKEILGDDQNAIDAYVKEKGYHNDPAWIKQRERIEKLEKESADKSTLAEEDRVALEEFKKFRSSSEYIKQSMKQQGFTQEKIDEKLKESGFDVDTKADDVQFILDKTGTKREDLTEGQIAQIEDVVKITDLLIKEKLGKVLPEKLAPVEDHIANMQKAEGATKLMTTIKDTVKTEGILDFGKDIEPALNKFLDVNEDATQQDVLEHFKTINHSLTVDRLKLGNKQDERDEKKGSQRQNISTVRTPTGVPDKTGDFDKDADAFLDAAGMT